MREKKTVKSSATRTVERTAEPRAGQTTKSTAKQAKAPRQAGGADRSTAAAVERTRRAAAARDEPTDSGPRLLSGGNPQIQKGAGDAPVQAYLAAMPDWKQRVGRRLDELIVRAVPGVRKAVRWNTPFYGIDGRGWFVAFHCITKYVKVTFFRGSELRPVPPVASKQPNVRYFHVHEHDELDEALITKWLAQAAKLPGENCF